MSGTLLEVVDLSVRLPTGNGERLILDRVSLTIDPGKAVGLVGESGSGKSTTARSVAQILPPGASCEGTVLFDGRDVLSMTPNERRALRAHDVQMIFQDARAHINPVRRVGDFLTEALRCHMKLSRTAADRTVVALLDEVGVGRAQERLRQYPHELSGGLLQRIMIAAALAVGPRLLIADEPTTALDVTTQASVIALLDRLRHERDMAVLFITHDLELASAICDRIAVMYAGTIVEEQPARIMHRQPLHPYTAALFASRPDVTRTTPRLPTIPGPPVAAADATVGCPFASRCRYAIDECLRERPPLVSRSAGHVACIRADQISETLRELVPASA